ncbi:polysaccharide deacetylase family protein [Sulfurospirillum oryzae]|uniref:polysaccharide deacetylase family protein n=1 Tax=Sulfurospirillum oryzae TaxID=2976535 RepID=UPI0021E85468|nr:polysaccharide deacetylase family protein [Sulfurospirillum oryzae]
MRFITWFLLFSIFCYANGPEKIATFDRALWPYPIHSKSAFDDASRHEIISYVRQINSINLSDITSITEFTSIKNINFASVSKWLTFTQNNLVNNFKQAQKSCNDKQELCQNVSNWHDLSTLSAEYKSNQMLFPWYAASQTFFSYYLYEQVRLAALFPRITSEIDTLDEREVQGFDYSDGQFLLTFDDGPKYSQTPLVADKLHKLNINGMFFVLGENLESALKTHGTNNLKQLYEGMCVGSHGYMHKPHLKLENWTEFYDKTRSMITDNQLQGTSKNHIWFRPPYGQRQQELVNRLWNLGDKVMLWNIDSQDWNQKLTTKQVQDRTITLMLLHRKGIILFHDIHPKALKVIEELDIFHRNQITSWVNCKEIGQ